MPSPFPGMDPWLENPTDFPDIHDALIGYLREELNAVLPKGYRARGRRRLILGRSEPRTPDVGILGPKPPSGGGTAVVTAEFAAVGMLRVPAAGPKDESYLDVLTAEGRLVTSVEILSPSNKKPASDQRRSYLVKQRRVRRAGVGLVEIDLLRAGLHTTAVPRKSLRRLRPEVVYHVCVCGAAVGNGFQIAAVGLTERLPVFAVPLDVGMTPVRVDLQTLFDRSYDTGRYDDLDYSKPPRPPLTADQQTWADAVLNRKPKLKP